jgi:hypothetical protein
MGSLEQVREEMRDFPRSFPPSFGEGWDTIPREKKPKGIFEMSTYRTKTDAVIRSAVWSQILLGVAAGAVFYIAALLDVAFNLFAASAGTIGLIGLAISVSTALSIFATLMICLIFDRLMEGKQQGSDFNEIA